MKFLILLGIISLANADYPDTTSTASHFCNMKVCSSKKKSIACSYTSDANIKCDGKLEPVDSNLILSVHNNYRQKIASGGYEPQYETATDMGEMSYSDELAIMASYNAKRCYFGHDKCRKTENFPHAGQNIANIKKSSDDFNLTSDFTEMMDSWFNEYKDADMSFINNYHKSDKEIGHFTQMVKDTATQIGCAASKYKDGSWNVLYLVCNYAVTNLRGQPTYIAGPTASACAETSDEYPALCVA